VRKHGENALEVALGAPEALDDFRM